MSTQLMNFMHESPSEEDDSRSASRETPHLLCKPKFHYHACHWSPNIKVKLFLF